MAIQDTGIIARDTTEAELIAMTQGWGNIRFWTSTYVIFSFILIYVYVRVFEHPQTEISLLRAPNFSK